MNNVIAFPSDTTDTLWKRYQALAKAYLRDPHLSADREHCEAMARAFNAWQASFLKRENAA